MLKRNPNQYLVSVYLKTDAFGNAVEKERFFDHPELKEFLIADGFSNEVASYIVTELQMERTKHLYFLNQTDINRDLPNLTQKDKGHLLEIVIWARNHKTMIDNNFKHL